ncbi:G2/mitotic-specific cyclin, variant 2 [Entomophthora muscae]|nr:G2/mitotic-specific cyclin, variant 2 [Entomophthora muscae]
MNLDVVDLTCSTPKNSLIGVSFPASSSKRQRLNSGLARETSWSTPQDKVRNKGYWNQRPLWVSVPKGEYKAVYTMEKSNINNQEPQRVFEWNPFLHPRPERLEDPDLDQPCVGCVENLFIDTDQEYQEDRLNYMLRSEASFLCNSNYIDLQPNFSWNDRTRIIGFMTTLCYSFKALPSIIHLAVNILDRYLSLRRLEVGELNSVALISVLLAAKNETSQFPRAKRLIEASKLKIADVEVIKWERRILKALDFKLTLPNPIAYLDAISPADECHLPTKLMARFLLEMMLTNHFFLKFCPSLLAGFCFYISMKILGRGSWGKSFEKVSGITREALLLNGAILLANLAETLKTQAPPFFKYRTEKYLRVAELATR